MRSPIVPQSLFGIKWPFQAADSNKNTEGKNDSLLKWARVAKRGCELAPSEAPEGYKLATIAGGCFWGLELAFQRVPGVIKTSVGYIGGKTKNPTYEEVCYGETGHAEAVQCVYDPNVVSYGELLEVFFSRVDPTTLNRQGADYGSQYRSVLYYHDPEQKEAAEKKIQELRGDFSQYKLAKQWVGYKVVTTVEAAQDYYIAEAYHQQYLQKGGRFGMGQSAEKGCKDPIRCYG